MEDGMGIESRKGFRIIVCVKQVPETTEVEIDPETGTLRREGVPAVVNPFDLHAIEEAVRIKERHGGVVTAISMGPPQAESAVRDALALGCDEGILLTDRTFAGADTLATAYTLGRAIRKLGVFDLVICGMKTTDGDTAQVGPELAEELEIPHVAYVNGIRELTESHMEVEKLMEDGLEVIKVPLPCLITVTKGINEPRLPSLKAKLQARRSPITIWGSGDLGGDPSRYGLTGSPTRVVRVFTPEPHGRGEIITGNPGMQAGRLLEKLMELRLI
ncbi:MAG: electron transfer flavoprotein subunit beta/FixA family protein [Candidatus Bathyarchaeia archaeon]